MHFRPDLVLKPVITLYLLVVIVFASMQIYQFMSFSTIRWRTIGRGEKHL